MLRALLDSDAVDPIADLPGALEAVKRAIERGDLQLLIPERAFEQIGRAKEPRRQELIEAASVAEQVLDGAYSVERGRIGVHRIASEAEAGYYQRVRGESEKDKHAPDALIALTAQFEGAVLVTIDKRLFGRASTDRQPVINPYAMLALIGYKTA